MAQLKRIGIYFSKSKWEKFGGESFIQRSRERGVEMVLFEEDKDFEEYLPIDIFIWKVTDQLVRYDTDPEQKALVDKFEVFLEAHKEILVIDPLACQKAVVDRSNISAISEKLEIVLGGVVPLRHPRFAIVDGSDKEVQMTTEYITELMRINDVHLPVICKPVQACGTVESHLMGIVHHVEDILSFPPPFLIQEFYNHDGVIFKVFTVGRTTRMVKRQSIRNMPVDHHDGARLAPLMFDSQQMSKIMVDPADMDTVPYPDQKDIDLISQGITDNFGMHIVGYDVITNNVTKKHSIVDVNFFPGFVGVHDIFDQILDLCFDLFAKKQNPN